MITANVLTWTCGTLLKAVSCSMKRGDHKFCSCALTSVGNHGETTERVLFSLQEAADKFKCSTEKILEATGEGTLRCYVAVPEQMHTFNVRVSRSRVYADLLTPTKTYSRKDIARVDYLGLSLRDCDFILRAGRTQQTCFDFGMSIELSDDVQPKFGRLSKHSLAQDILGNDYVVFGMFQNEKRVSDSLQREAPYSLLIVIDQIYVNAADAMKWTKKNAEASPVSEVRPAFFESYPHTSKKLRCLYMAYNHCWVKDKSDLDSDENVRDYDEYSRKYVAPYLREKFGGRLTMAKVGADIIRPEATRRTSTPAVPSDMSCQDLPRKLVAVRNASSVWANANRDESDTWPGNGRNVIPAIRAELKLLGFDNFSDNFLNKAAAIIRPEWAESGSQTKQLGVAQRGQRRRTEGRRHIGRASS